MNPISKARQIVDYITHDIFIANKLLGIITHELTEEEIHTVWIEHELHLNALNESSQITLFND